MWIYIVRRTLQGVLVLFLVSLTIFALVRSLPGDVIIMQLDQAAALSKEDLARARQELGLDRPFWQQYGIWIRGVLHGDLGHSLTSRKPVSGTRETCHPDVAPGHPGAVRGLLWPFRWALCQPYGKTR